jgi:predicted metal-dependent hydrolase
MIEDGLYDPRYLAGILFFNERAFFEAHEVWENVWMEAAGLDHRFYQGLIQAAVALHHFGNGNVRGAVKLYRTSRAYMEPIEVTYLGLDKAAFWEQMAVCFAELLHDPDPARAVRPDEGLIPIISLNPAPESWPDPEQYLDSKD